VKNEPWPDGLAGTPANVIFDEIERQRAAGVVALLVRRRPGAPASFHGLLASWLELMVARLAQPLPAPCRQESRIHTIVEANGVLNVPNPPGKRGNQYGAQYEAAGFENRENEARHESEKRDSQADLERLELLRRGAQHRLLRR
jgi:hypothetical protein